ncbi:STAS domain-containing protein [Kutzneria sp. CA-103260]|uniref:STAS domain-containing protein n=1 Tax=Kutzneria sp. CA-103260 TaxID=2802641 RepID=UPI001BA97E27|nr:STAS domain-containing protein [Kutzneria sp. CA-103260]QUQ63405.1 Putative anti-sigma factor antagonist [Kutzneria sp. CA-103260]
MSIRLEHIGSVAVVHVTDEVDMATEAQLRATLTDAVSAGPAALVLDLTCVTFFASAGLHVLVDVQHDATARGLDMLVAADKRSVLRPLQITGVDQLVTVVASVDQALAHS